MNRDTFTATFRAFKHRAPFRPFTVVTISGNRHEVDHPDALAINDGVALFAGPGGDPVIFDYEGVSELIGNRRPVRSWGGGVAGWTNGKDRLRWLQERTRS